VPTEVLFTQGDPADGLYVLMSGALQVSYEGPFGTTIEVGRIEEGALVGEMAVIDPQPRSATVSADGSAIVLKLPSEAFMRLVDDGHPAAGNILGHLREMVCDRLRKLDARVDAVDVGPSAHEEGPTLLERLKNLWATLILRGG